MSIGPTGITLLAAVRILEAGSRPECKKQLNFKLLCPETICLEFTQSDKRGPALKECQRRASRRQIALLDLICQNSAPMLEEKIGRIATSYRPRPRELPPPPPPLPLRAW
jgi:hypothetical protein